MIYDRRVAIEGGQRQRGDAISCGPVDLCALGEKQLDDFGVACRNRMVQSRRAVSTRGIDDRPIGEDRSNGFAITLACGLDEPGVGFER